jgi:hypothetical protein
MMEMINKTDKLDVHGFNRLQRNRTLPTVWIAPAELRDLREIQQGEVGKRRQGGSSQTGCQRGFVMSAREARRMNATHPANSFMPQPRAKR